MMQLVVEIDGDKNQNWYAPFLQRSVRGRFDYTRVRNPFAMMESAQISAIPGQRLAVDPDKRVARILEPLRDPEHAGLAKKLAKKLGQGESLDAALEPAEQVIELKEDRDVQTWYYWLRRAVQGGVARVLQGKLPTDAQCHGAKKQFIVPEAVDRHADLRRQELAAKLAMMSPEQRREYDKLLAEMK